MPQFLYQLRPRRIGMVRDGPNEQEQPILAAHLDYLQKLKSEGCVLMAGRTQNNDDSTFGLCVFVAKDTAAAQAIVDADPAIQQGLMTAELFPFRVAVWAGDAIAEK